jgi:hypothetical protein
MDEWSVLLHIRTIVEKCTPLFHSHQIDYGLISLGIEVSVRTSTVKDHKEALYAGRLSTKKKLSRS